MLTQTTHIQYVIIYSQLMRPPCNDDFVYNGEGHYSKSTASNNPPPAPHWKPPKSLFPQGHTSYPRDQPPPTPTRGLKWVATKPEDFSKRVPMVKSGSYDEDDYLLPEEWDPDYVPMTPPPGPKQLPVNNYVDSNSKFLSKF